MNILRRIARALLSSLNHEDISEIIAHQYEVYGEPIAAHIINKEDQVIFILPERTPRESLEEFNEILSRLLRTDSFAVITHEGKLDLVRFQ